MIILRLRNQFDQKIVNRPLKTRNPAASTLVAVLIRLTVALALAQTAFSENVLVWNSSSNLVSADIRHLELSKLLEQVATDTGWQVYIEPNTARDVSAKFKNAAPGDALRFLLGNLNYALVPQTNSPARLYVFRTSQGNATRRIHPVVRTAAGRATIIRNQLIVRLKPGQKIEDLARSLGARVTGRIDALNTYRLEFDSDASAATARTELSNNPNVDAIDYNFSVEPPPLPEPAAGSSAPNWNLQLKQNDGPCQIVVGLIDTAVAPLGPGAEPFLLPALSVSGDTQTPVTSLTHGTAMAETILQSIQNSSGGKTSVKILPVNVYGSAPSTTTFDVGQGIYMAATQKSNPANVFNLSLGGAGDSAFLRSLITSLSQQGVVFFGAAGNDPVTTDTYPAAYPGVIAVTASGANGQIATYANRGSFVSLMEPGTSFVGFQGQTWAVTGTSTATAIASGQAAGIADSTHACPDQVIPSMRATYGFKPGAAP